MNTVQTIFTYLQDELVDFRSIGRLDPLRSLSMYTWVFMGRTRKSNQLDNDGLHDVHET